MLFHLWQTLVTSPHSTHSYHNMCIAVLHRYFIRITNQHHFRTRDQKRNVLIVLPSQSRYVFVCVCAVFSGCVTEYQRAYVLYFRIDGCPKKSNSIAHTNKTKNNNQLIINCSSPTKCYYNSTILRFPRKNPSQSMCRYS